MALTRINDPIGKYCYFTYYTTSGGTDTAETMTEAVAPAVPFYIDEVRLHLSVVHASVVDYIISLSSELGSAYNTLFLSQAMNGEKDVIWQPERPKRFRAGDQLSVNMIMSGSNYYGITISGWTIVE